MKNYIAKTNLLLGGKHIPVGDTVELADDDAERLAAVVTLVEDEVDAEAGTETETEAEAKAKAEAESIRNEGVGTGQEPTIRRSREGGNPVKHTNPQGFSSIETETEIDAETDTDTAELDTLIAAFTDSGSNLKKAQLITLAVALGVDVSKKTPRQYWRKKLLHTCHRKMTDHYASVTDFIHQFGSQSVAAFVDRSDDKALTGECLLATALIDDVTSYSDEDVAAATEAVALISHHLHQSAKEINSYLIGRYMLPIAVDVIDNSPLLRISGDITRYLIASSADLLSELIETRYQDAVKWLQQISSGKVSLPQASMPAQTDHTASLRFTTGVQVNTDGYG